MIFWDNFIHKDDRRKYATACPQCQAVRYLARFQALRNAPCRHCSCADKSKQWHLANPSGPERNIIRQLTEMSLSFEREVRLLYYNIDFVINGTHAIEIDSGNLHRDLYDPEYDRKRYVTIEQHYPLLRITDGNTQHCKRLIKEFLNG